MAKLPSTKTHANLQAAFAGESQANRRYLCCAKIADGEGYPEVAGNFRETAEGETGHAHGHLDYLKQVGDPATGLPIGSTANNLKAAIAGETHEYTDMYPGMAKRRARRVRRSRTVRNAREGEVAAGASTRCKRSARNARGPPIAARPSGSRRVPIPERRPHLYAARPGCRMTRGSGYRIGRLARRSSGRRALSRGGFFKFATFPSLFTDRRDHDGDVRPINLAETEPSSNVRSCNSATSMPDTDATAMPTVGLPKLVHRPRGSARARRCTAARSCPSAIRTAVRGPARASAWPTSRMHPRAPLAH